MSSRPDVVSELAARLQAMSRGRRLVAVDGVDGSGKTYFAARLAEALRLAGREVVEVHVDEFHHLRARRYQRGRTSPEGFWLDSYDYEALERDVLKPLSAGGSGTYRTSATDLEADRSIDVEPLTASDDAIGLVEGIFLHRDELAGWWDFSIYLDVPFEESVRRMALRDGTPDDPEHPLLRRYVGGQRLYFRDCRPWSRASAIVDNRDWREPVLRPSSGAPLS